MKIQWKNQGKFKDRSIKFKIYMKENNTREKENSILFKRFFLSNSVDIVYIKLR